MNLGIGVNLTTTYQPIPAVALDLDAAIAALFSSGEVGAWYDPSDSSTVWQDAAGTTPAGVGDPVGRIDDKSGNGNHATQSTSAARPVLQQSGGLYYLDFDGVDDALTTAAVDLSGTNQLAVAAGVRDVAMTGTRGTVFNTNLGNFNGASLFAPSTVLNQIQFSAFGDSGGGSMSLLETGLPNSLTAVLLANTDLSTTSNVLRRDGAVVATAGTAGAGNYTNTPLYFGHRGGSSFFNGNLCACVVIDRTLTAGEITDLETYLASKSGVTI